MEQNFENPKVAYAACFSAFEARTGEHSERIATEILALCERVRSFLRNLPERTELQDTFAAFCSLAHDIENYEQEIRMQSLALSTVAEDAREVRGSLFRGKRESVPDECREEDLSLREARTWDARLWQLEERIAYVRGKAEHMFFSLLPKFGAEAALAADMKGDGEGFSVSRVVLLCAALVRECEQILQGLV